MRKDCYNLIFQPGFSTKTEISDVSGRGVGMDVVKTRITQMNGSVDIDSELGSRQYHHHQIAVDAGDTADADGGVGVQSFCPLKCG